MDSKCYYRFHAVLLSNNGHAFGCKNCFFRNPARGKRTPPPYLESQHERYSIHVEKNELHRSYRQLAGNVVECVSDVYSRSIIFFKKKRAAPQNVERRPVSVQLHVRLAEVFLSQICEGFRRSLDGLVRNAEGQSYVSWASECASRNHEDSLLFR